MRKWLLTIVTACSLASSAGCLLPMYSADPGRRAQQLIYTSENLRVMLNEWERIWFLDMPSHLTPQSTHRRLLASYYVCCLLSAFLPTLSLLLTVSFFSMEHAKKNCSITNAVKACTV